MADPYRLVAPGRPIDISAKTMNGLLRAGRENDQHKYDVPDRPLGLDPQRPPKLHNGLSTALDAFAVLGFGASIVQPHLVPFEAAGQPVFEAAAPTSALPFCIAREPIPAGGLGDVVTHGPAVVKVLVTDEAHAWATISDGVTTHLLSAASGGAPILWKESGTGLKMAQVMLGASNPLPTVYASDGQLIAGVGFTLMDQGSRTVPRGDYLAISTFGASFKAPGGGIPTFPVFVNAHFALGMWDASVNPPVSYFIRSSAYRVTEVAGSDVTIPPPQANRFSFYTMNQSFSRDAQDALIPGTGPIKIGLFYEVLFGIGQVLPYDHSLSLVPCLLPDE